MPTSILEQIYALLRALQRSFDKCDGNLPQFLDDGIAKLFGREFPSTVQSVYDEYEVDLPEMPEEVEEVENEEAEKLDVEEVSEQVVSCIASCCR